MKYVALQAACGSLPRLKGVAMDRCAPPPQKRLRELRLPHWRAGWDRRFHQAPNQIIASEIVWLVKDDDGLCLRIHTGKVCAGLSSTACKASSYPAGQ